MELGTDGRGPRAIVGVGASAGGLDALEQLFAEMPVDTGLAFVVVQHLSPDFKSLMDEILGRRTRLLVVLAVDGARVVADRVFLIPPKKEMIISRGCLLLTDKSKSPELALPIDIFFRSLAEDAGPRAVGVVLSGGGSDGSRGIRDIHAAGGLVICQDEASATFDGMPRSARDTGIVDYVAPPRDIPRILVDHVARAGGLVEPYAIAELPPRGLTAVFGLLERQYGIDFSVYKPSTVTRRVERRMQLLDCDSTNEYAERLADDHAELDALYRDLLIGVTRFFRDAEAFENLAQAVLPDLLQRRTSTDEIRIWVPGCATGEEAYSLAILLHEVLDRSEDRRRLKIFATDVHPGSLETAGRGLYSRESIDRVSPTRLERYFEKNGDAYQVAADLRQLVVFARHNVMRDAPFTHLDLISCRNLLIYFQPVAQRRVLGLFHFALKRQGVLFLGPSENAAALADDFVSVDGHWRIYRKHREMQPRQRAGVVSPGRAQAGSQAALSTVTSYPLSQTIAVYDALLDEHMPPGLLINDKHELVHAFGGAGRFMQMKDGRPSLDVLGLVGQEMKPVLAAALQRVSREKCTVALQRLKMTVDGETGSWTVAVKPVTSKRGAAPHMLVTIEPSEPAATAVDDEERAEILFDEISNSQLAALEAELGYTKESLSATIEELETSNEELQGTNEELLASNEELQSTNEELQSVNEELYTVNAEYQKKISQLTELTNDMDNLLQSTDVGTVFLDRELCVRKFTSRIAEVFSLMPQDVGRPIAGFSSTLDHPSLVDDLHRVLTSSAPLECEVRDTRGHWFFLRILPYRAGGRVEGVVLTLVDIRTLKAAEDALFRERHLLDSLMENVPDAIYFKDAKSRFIRLNRAMARRLAVLDPVDAVGKRTEDLAPPDVARPLEAADRRILAGDSQPYRLEQLGHAGYWYMTTRQPLRDGEGNVVGLFGISRDVTEQQQAEEEIRQSVVRRDRFLAMLSHELRNPLSAIVSAASLLAQDSSRGPRREVDVIERQAGQMAKLLDDLLEASRITQNKITLDKRVVDIREVVKDAEEAVRDTFAARNITLQLALPQAPLFVEGDPVRLQQVLVNLLGNAAKYTPAAGSTELAVQEDGGRVVVTVRDDGAGIEPRLLGPIFDMFFQGETGLFRSDSSMGLGLALVRSLVEMHGGQVAAYSAGRGRGSTFTVRLPLATGRPSSAQVNQPRRIQWSGVKRIALIDDNVDSSAMLQAVLSSAGYEVHCAHDGLAGIELVERVSPDVALVDIGLPGTDGYEVARRLRSLEQHRHLYLVAFTGYGRAADRVLALQAGFDEHVTKPLRPEELSDLLTKRS